MMKKYTHGVMALFVTSVLTSMAGSALAASISPTVVVTGILNGVCKAGATGTMAFTIDPSLAGPVAATKTDATLFCSNGTPFTITAASNNKGAAPASCASSGSGITGTLIDASNNQMDYTFKCGVNGTAGNTGTGQGLGSGKDLTLGIAGSIAAAMYQNAPVSTTYVDTVTLTITY